LPENITSFNFNLVETYNGTEPSENQSKNYNEQTHVPIKQSKHNTQKSASSSISKSIKGFFPVS